jgi:hypothetical protein
MKVVESPPAQLFPHVAGDGFPFRKALLQMGRWDFEVPRKHLGRILLSR